jgi:RNA polymerase sigma factor (sigma-70 family)
MLKRFDREHPQMAIFPDHHGPARPETKRDIYRLYQQGESAAALAERYCRPLANIRQIVLELRAQRVMSLELAYIPHAEFERIRTTRQERALLAPAPPSEPLPKPRKTPGDLPPYLASLYETPLLTHEQEVYLFRKMNYLKYKANSLRSQLDPARPQGSLLDRIETLYDQSLAAKNQIISANLRLVVSIAKRHFAPGADLFSLISDGNMSLIRAVDKYDFARGFKFSTYASWAIMKNFARTIPGERRHQDRFRAGMGDVFASAEDVRTDPHELEDAHARQESAVAQILQRLDTREREIITRRFGLVRGQEPLTLKQVGELMGVTKERVRQIEVRAMSKLRAAAVEEGLGELALT